MKNDKPTYKYLPLNNNHFVALNTLRFKLNFVWHTVKN